jgi:sulfur-carrier protein adenylyltransferase/sulfurtransferase
MKWKNFFKPVGNMDPKEAKVYMAEHQEGSYTLLDVRQPREYEESRIPGATLIPLPQLTDHLHELDPEKPLLAYCAIGGRSRAAAQLLAGQGFKEVYNLKGGIKAWKGQTAEGAFDFGNELSGLKEMSYQGVVRFALGMEKGLAEFYLLAARETGDKDLAELLRKLAGIEEKHQQHLLELYQSFNSTGEIKEPILDVSETPIMEGGFNPSDFYKQHQSLMKTGVHLLNLAMVLETQALDLYLRLAAYVENEKSRKILQRIGDEEKAHLAALGKMLEAGH